MKYKNIQEKEIKNQVTQDFFSKFDCTKILGKIDFTVKPKEFKQVYNQIEKITDNDIPWKTYLFDFEKDETELRRFIREYFQGRNRKGKMNNKSDNEKYNELISKLREKLQLLAKKIKPKVYEYEFLK
ncbi:MAG: hypothetical protein LBS25_06685 [Candidatus Symbiothrix sp.]|jgi:hypothetical protein|nr:hypothetical protein [Candidatus Symbiothrix sp.]